MKTVAATQQQHRFKSGLSKPKHTSRPIDPQTRCDKCGKTAAELCVYGNEPTPCAPSRDLLFVGECRSLTAQRKGWTWADGRLAARPLFEALAAMGVDAAAHKFVNLWTDNATGITPGTRGIGRVTIGWQRVELIRHHSETGVVVALGKRVSIELAKRGIVHVALVHPAARGRIRKRERYIEHVHSKLKPAMQAQEQA